MILGKSVKSVGAGLKLLQIRFGEFLQNQMQALIYSLVFVVFICIHELAEMLGFVHFYQEKEKSLSG